MSTPIPPKFCSAVAAFELIGRRVYGDNWTRKEIKARRLPGPEKVRKAKEIVAQESLNSGELSNVVGFYVRPEAVQEWPDPANPDYEIERAAYDRAKKVRTTLWSILRSGVTSWILTKDGKTIEIPTIWFEQRGRIDLHILFNPDALRLTHACTDEASMSQGQGGPLGKRVKGRLYLGHDQLHSALSEISKRTQSTTGRYPKSRTQVKTIHELFDLMAKGKQFTYGRGELTNIAKEIADDTRVEYSIDYVRRLISPAYNQLKEDTAS